MIVVLLIVLSGVRLIITLVIRLAFALIVVVVVIAVIVPILTFVIARVTILIIALVILISSTFNIIPVFIFSLRRSGLRRRTTGRWSGSAWTERDARQMKSGD